MSSKGYKRQLLAERGNGNAARVDRDAGVLRGVKVCGLTSANGRRYLPQALREAVPLYEGMPCYRGHKEGVRSDDDLVGEWTNPHFVEGEGVFADLKYLKTSKASDKLLEVAERMPAQLGFSHVAEGDQDKQTGDVLRIHKIHSVDLVTDPATTNGVWESKGKAMKLLEYLQKLAPRIAKDRRVTFLEMGLGYEEEPMPTDMPEPAGEDPDEALRAGFEAAIIAIVGDDSLDASAKAKKITQLLKTHEKLTAEEPEPAKETESEGDGEKKDDAGDKKDDEKKDDDKKEESKRKAAVKTLCESLDFTPPANLREQLEAADTLADRLKLIELFRPTVRVARSTGRGTQSTQTKVPANGKELAAACRE